MRTLRVLLVVGGLGAIGFGLWHGRDFESSQLRSGAVWLAGGVVVHDFVLAPIVVGLGIVLARVVPTGWRTPLVVAFVVWGSLTLVALPVLSGMGKRPDNPSLLDRPYGTAWWVVTALVGICVLAYGWLRRAADT